MKQKEIRFIDSNYNELFRIKDGESITVIFKDGSMSDRKCTYIGDYHTQIGYNTFHICEFAELMEKNGSSYMPTNVPKRVMLILHDNGKNLSELRKDKFFVVESFITEMFYNPDAVSGGQLVYNEISKDLIQFAAENSKNADEFFIHIDGGCTQYLIDMDTPEFKGSLESFINHKADFEGVEGCPQKAMKALKKYAGIEQQKTHKKNEPER